MNVETRRLRTIQEVILRDLAIKFEATPEIPLLWRHILYGFSTGVVPYAEDEIRAALADLVERELAAASDEEGLADLPEKGYRITAVGRDFLRARCPWELLDRFGGSPCPPMATARCADGKGGPAGKR